MNGSNEKDNLVNLTPREHYIAHLLLYKIYENTSYKYSLLKAVVCMIESNKKNRKIHVNSKIYERNRIAYYSSNFSKEAGRKGYLEFIKKDAKEISNIRNRAKISREKWFKSLTNEEKLEIFKNSRISFLGKKHTELSKKKMKESSKNNEKTGINNPMYGKIWITNIETKENKLIDKKNIIPTGWKKVDF